MREKINQRRVLCRNFQQKKIVVYSITKHFFFSFTSNKKQLNNTHGVSSIIISQRQMRNHQTAILALIAIFRHNYPKIYNII
jgi:hypothetical protein